MILELTPRHRVLNYEGWGLCPENAGTGIFWPQHWNDSWRSGSCLRKTGREVARLGPFPAKLEGPYSQGSGTTAVWLTWTSSALSQSACTPPSACAAASVPGPLPPLPLTGLHVSPGSRVTCGHRWWSCCIGLALCAGNTLVLVWCGLSFFGLVLHASQVWVTCLGSQSLLPNHCMDGIRIAKRLYSGLSSPLFCCRLEPAEILNRSRGLKQPCLEPSPRAKSDGCVSSWCHLRWWAGKATCKAFGETSD